jgi:hypothetical protein
MEQRPIKIEKLNESTSTTLGLACISVAMPVVFELYASNQSLQLKRNTNFGLTHSEIGNCWHFIKSAFNSERKDAGKRGEGDYREYYST